MDPPGGDVAPRIYTIGHSSLDAAAFFALVAAAGIEVLADVRAFPASRRHPHFERGALAAAAAAHGVAYHWMPGLGGRRRALVASSPHVAWKVAAFRNYADYMETDEFAAALGALEALARRAPTAFLCAEALWWQCHRRLIADRLLVNGWTVEHVGAGGRPSVHRLPEFARVVAGRIVYDVGATPPLPLAPRARRHASDSEAS